MATNEAVTLFGFPESLTEGQMLSTDARICSKCGRSKPLGAFRRRYKDGDVRHPECNDCRNALERRLRERRREHELRDFENGIIRARTASATEALAAAMTARFGGAKRLSAAWHESMKKAEEKGHFARLNKSLDSLLQLMMRANEIYPKGAIEAAAVRWVEANPEVVVAIADALGWDVRPKAKA